MTRQRRNYLQVDCLFPDFFTDAVSVAFQSLLMCIVEAHLFTKYSYTRM